MTEWISPEGKQIGNSTVEVIAKFEVPSNSWSGIGGTGSVRSLWMEVNTEARKQCVELESTKVGMVIPRTKAEVSWSVKEFGLERADVLRCSSTEAPTRLTQPWSSAGAKGLLPIFFGSLAEELLSGAFSVVAAHALAAAEVAFRHSLAI